MESRANCRETAVGRPPTTHPSIHPCATAQTRQSSLGLSHEDAVLAEFKKMISDAGFVISGEMTVLGDLDATLHRFLRARKYKLEAAFAMLESESDVLMCMGGCL